MRYRLITTGLIIIIVSVQFQNCSSDKRIDEGYRLAKKHCAACHRFPEASALNKNTWNKAVLPKMAPYLGYSYIAGGYLEADTDTGILTMQQWNNIVRYYISEAPDSLVAEKKSSVFIRPHSSLFTAQPFYAGIKKPATTLVMVDTLDKKIVFGDGSSEKVFLVTPNLTIIDSFETGVGSANAAVADSGLYILTMGVLYPSDVLAGKLLYKSKTATTASVILDSLRRPVHASFADLNNDGREDVIICEFGNGLGALGWYENNGQHTYTKHLLRPLPGAIKTMLYDFNNDGKKDIIALMAQGDEGIFIYYNQGNGAFREERLLQFPPYYGSNHFQVADINNDGYTDIITTHGDNGDYKPILKPYHGIRVFLNNGKNEFAEKKFLPVNGIGKVIIMDFDADGDLDMCSIAYFPDYIHKAQEAFIYWENTGNMKFIASSVAEVTEGRWLTMDAGDIDGDGDYDIVLGNADFRLGNIPETLKNKWDALSPSLLILKNNLR